MSSARSAAFRITILSILHIAFSRSLDAAFISWTNSGGGTFSGGANWQGGVPPGPSDSAVFDLPNEYLVQWNNSVGNVVNQRLSMSSGFVTFLATGGDFTYKLDDPYMPDVNFGTAEISGATVTLGAVSGSSFTLEAISQLQLGDYGHLNVGFGGRIIAPNIDLTILEPSGRPFVSLNVIDGGRITTHSLSVGRHGDGFVSIEGAGSIVISDLLSLGQEHGLGVASVVNGAALSTAGTAYIGNGADNEGQLTIASNATWNVGDVFIGASGGSGGVFLFDHGTMSANEIQVGAGGALLVLGGSVMAASLNLNGGLFQLEGSTGTPSTVSITDHVGYFRLPPSALTQGILVLDENRILDVAGTTIIEPGATVIVNHPNAFDSSSLQNNGKLVVNADLTLADPSLAGNKQYYGGGHLEVGPMSALSLLGAGYASLGHLTRLSGGFIFGDGVAIPAGGHLEGSGVVDAKVAGAPGSLITINGGMTLGSLSNVAGFSTQGEILVTGTLSILDANQAELGPLTTLNPVGGLSFLQAQNGLRLEASDNLIGSGVVSGGLVINHGNIAGQSPTDPLYMACDVTGDGQLHNVRLEANYSPGFAIGSVTVGSIEYAGLLQIDVAGLVPGLMHDQVNHLGDVVLGGGLKIIPIGPFAPKDGDLFQVLTATGDITGKFASLDLPQLPGNLSWTVDYSAHAVSLRVGQPSGDFNGDHIVNGGDLINWKAGFGTTASAAFANGDADRDADVDGRDFLIWQRQIGQNISSSSIDLVPEPRALSIAFYLGVVALKPGLRSGRRITVRSRSKFRSH